MSRNFLMPKLAMAMNEGIVSEWLVTEGQLVKKGDPIAAVETEKVAYDVESPEEGYFHILLPVGESVPVESVIGVFADSEEEYKSILAGAAQDERTSSDSEVISKMDDPVSLDVATDTVGSAISKGSARRIKSSPLARKLAADSGVEISTLQGTGPGGRIVKRDIVAALESGVAGSGIARSTAGNRALAKIPMTGMRQAIAGKMLQSLQSSAQVASGWESDITELLALRQRFVDREKQLGTKVSVNAFIVRAICYAIKQVPIVNSIVENEEIIVCENVNMGIATALPGETKYDSTLMVPVIHNVDAMGVVEIDRAMKEVVKKAREGNLSASELSGSTITLSSTAGIAPPGLTTTPVINRPNAAIVGPSTPIRKPVIFEGEVIARTMLPVSFTFDHCVLDGAPAAEFMRALHECLEDPGLMLA